MFLSKSAFAASQGWSPSYITKLGHQGRLVMGPNPKLIDVSATLAGLKITADPRKEGVRQHHADARVAKHVGAHIKFDAPTDDMASSRGAPKYWDNKARREGALADLAEIELATKRRELVDRHGVEAMAIAAGTKVRDSMLALPAKLAPAISTMTDAFAIEIMLRDALRRVFADASEMMADDLIMASAR